MPELSTTALASADAPTSPSPRVRLIENWIVAITLLTTAIVGWIHIHSASIWYDETVTLLMTAGHPVPDLSMGANLFKPTANLATVIHSLYVWDVHPPLYFLILSL